MMKNVNGVNVPCTPQEIAEIQEREAAWEAGKAVREAKAEIVNLENSITIRRLREAALSDEGKEWLQSVENQIVLLRNVINGV